MGVEGWWVSKIGGLAEEFLSQGREGRGAVCLSNRATYVSEAVCRGGYVVGSGFDNDREYPVSKSY